MALKLLKLLFILLENQTPSSAYLYHVLDYFSKHIKHKGNINNYNLTIAYSIYYK